MPIILGMAFGFIAWFLMRYLVAGIFTVDQNERAVKTVFGRAKRLEGGKSPLLADLEADERARYDFPQLEVIAPGGPYFKWPWEKVHKVTVATQTINMAFDPETPEANSGGTVLDAVTKDQLNTGLSGQIRYRVSERNLYAYLFGVKYPLAHIMGFFVSVLRERIANFESKATLAGTDADDDLVDPSIVSGVSINDLRKNLRDINEHMLVECKRSEARYGMVLDASLITGIDPPPDVDAALAAINTAHNHVSSEISLARASADQKLVQSKRAVEIETLKAEAEVEPLKAMAAQLHILQASGSGALDAYRRYVRLPLFERAKRVFLEVQS